MRPLGISFLSFAQIRNNSARMKQKIVTDWNEFELKTGMKKIVNYGRKQCRFLNILNDTKNYKDICICDEYIASTAHRTSFPQAK